MKTFFNKKRIAYVTILAATLITLIVLLIVPIGSLSDHCLISYKGECLSVGIDGGQMKNVLSSPFTVYNTSSPSILVWQTVVFTLVGIIFVVFLALFLVELKKAGVFNRTHHPTKTERLQAQIDELQRQVDELKKED